MAIAASALPDLSPNGSRVVRGEKIVVVDADIEIGPGIGGQWRDETSLHYGRQPDGAFMLWREGHGSTVVREQGFNVFAVAFGRWLGWRPDTGLVWPDGGVWPDWHSPALSETRWAAIHGTTLFAGLGDGQAGQVVAAHARDPRLVGNLLTWAQDEPGGAMSVWGQRFHGGPVLRLSIPGNTRQGYITAVMIDGQPWALSHDDARAYLYPWDDPSHGYNVAVAPAHRPDGRQKPDRIVRCVWDAEHDVLGEKFIDVRTEPRVSLSAVDPVVDMTSTVDVTDYFPIGLNLDGSHLLAFHMTGQQPNVLSVAKHEDGGGEWWAWDDQWVYVHMDQGGSPIEDVASGLFTPRFSPNGDRVDAYYFSPDARTWPRKAKTGDAFTLNTRLYYLADGPNQSGIPWPITQSFEVYSAWPTPFGPLPAIRQKSDPRTRRDPNGRLKGGYEYWTFSRSEDKRIWYVTWEQWRTRDDNSGDEIMVNPNDGKPLFREFSRVFDSPITWRLSRRPAAAPLLPEEDDMNRPGVTIDKYGPVIGPTGTWSVEFHDRNNPGVSGKVEIVNGSVHVTMTNPEGSDRSGNRRPVEIRS